MESTFGALQLLHEFQTIAERIVDEDTLVT
jgi:hypothetical protein